MKNIACYALTVLMMAGMCASAAVVWLDDDFKNAIELANTGGFEGKLDKQDGLTITFKKTGAERRMIAAKVAVKEGFEEHKALAMAMRVQLADGQTARPLVMFVEEDGGSWYRIGMPLTQEGMADVHLNLFNVQQTSFSRDGNGKFDWERIRELYLGVVVEGAGEGVVRIAGFIMTNDPFVPTKPVEIKLPTAKAVSRSADPAAKVTVEDVEIDGMRVLKETFAFPLGRHMYFTPSFQLPEMDYAVYSGFRLTYKATIPQPIGGLLVTVTEGGGQFVAPAPKATSEWLPIDLKFKDFKMSSWAKKKDGNTDFNVAGMSSMVMGCHGTANSDGGKGEILIRKIELIP